MINRKKQIFFVSSALVLSGILIFLIHLNSKKTNYYEISESVYDNINSGFYLQAEQQFPDLYSRIFNTQTALSFLKILYKYSSALDEYTQLENYAEKLFKRYSRNIEIAAVYSFALNQSEKHNRALELTGRMLSKSDYNSIYLVSSIKNGNIISNRKILEKIDEAYRPFFDGTEYNSESALNAAEYLMDERLIYNSAIMLMSEGQGQEALNHISLLSENSFPEVKMFISYDNKKFSMAEKYYLNLIEENKSVEPSLQVFGADIFLQTGKPSMAQTIYKGLIDQARDFSWIPYRNLYALNRSNAYGIKYLEEGLGYFPGEQHLVLPAAWEMYLSDNTQGLNTYLQSLENQNSSALSKLFKLNLEINSKNPEHVVGNYWTIYNLEPRSDDTFIAFSNYLLKNRFLDQLDLLINKHERVNGPNLWTLTYSAIEMAISGNYPEAEQKINTALENNTDTNLFYNKAVVLILLKNYDKALDVLQQAAIYESSHENNDDRLAKIYFKLSETYYTVKEYEKALHTIRKTLNILPNDIRSNLMLKKIKEEYND